MGRRVGAVDAAGEHRHGRSAAGERAPVGGLVDAERRTGHHARRRPGPVGAPISPATSAPYVVAEREPTTATGAVELVEPQRPLHPQPERTAARGPGPGAQWSRSSSCARPLGVAGHDEADARGARPGRGPAPGRSPPAWPATSVSTPPRSRSLGEVAVHARRAELGHQRGQPRVARLAETAEGHPGQALASVATRPASIRRSSARADARARPAQRLAGPEAQRRVELVDPGRSTPREVGDRPGQPVHPGGAAAGEPAGVHSASSSAAAGVGQGPLLAQHRAGRLAVEPPAAPGVALAAASAGPRSPGPGRPRTTRVGASGSLASCRLHRLDVADDVDPVDRPGR